MPAETQKSFVAALAIKYGQRLRRFLSGRLRNAADVPDLAQEVFLRLMRVEHHETIRSPEAYLFTVASHVLHQHTLRQSNIPTTLDIGEVLTELQLVSAEDGLRVAFLAYASVFPMGYEAQADKPGLAPMRVYNHWREANPLLHSPGRRPLAMTVPDQTDLQNLTEDIRRARDCADVVVTSFHWGDYWRRYHLTDHELKTARYCIDQGAHMVVGHHHHVLRGMEWYKGRPILYGLGHFVFDSRTGWSDEEFERRLRTANPPGPVDDNDFVPGLRAGWPLLPFPDDARLTALAWATAHREGVDAVGFLPCGLTPDGLVHPLELGSPESNEVVSYLEKCNQTQGLTTRIVADESIALAGYSSLRIVPS